MAGPLPIIETKGLKRATKQLKFIAEGVKNLQERNNNTSQSSGLHTFLYIGILRLFNITFSDLNISEFKPISIQAARNYCLLIISLYISGKTSKTIAIKSFGLHYTRAVKILAQFIDAGYIEKVPNKSIKSFNGIHYHKDVEHLQLTSKGYDLANHIGTLLVDDRLL